jgi:hypothetical protein
MGGSTEEAQERIGAEVARKLRDFLVHGSTVGAVNFPQLQLPRRSSGSRVLQVHRKTAGMIGRLGDVFTWRNIDIAAEYCQNDGEVGYAVIGIDQQRVHRASKDSVNGLGLKGWGAGLRSVRMAMSESRNNQRHRVLKAGKIVFNGGASVLDCTVRNVSETGACLVVVNAVAVPAEFDLLLDGASRSCEAVWRKPNRVGVEFRHTAHSADAPSSEAKSAPRNPNIPSHP